MAILLDEKGQELKDKATQIAYKLYEKYEVEMDFEKLVNYIMLDLKYHDGKWVNSL